MARTFSLEEVEGMARSAPARRFSLEDVERMAGADRPTLPPQVRDLPPLAVPPEGQVVAPVRPQGATPDSMFESAMQMPPQPKGPPDYGFASPVENDPLPPWFTPTAEARAARPSLTERFRANVADAFRGGTIAGAGTEYLAGKATGASLGPEAAERQRERQRDTRALYELMPGFHTAPTLSGKLMEGSASLAGQLVGSLPTPENLVSLPAKATALLTRPLTSAPARNIVRAGGDAAIVNTATDPLVQGTNLAAGTRDEYDPTQTALAPALGLGVGGGIAAAREGGKALKDALPPIWQMIAPRTPRTPNFDSGQAQARPEAPAPENPPAPAPESRPQADTPSGGDYVVTPRGRRVDVRSEVIEARDLIASHTDDLTPNPAYPAELQPRDRGRAASQAQVQEISGNLRPELLGPSRSASEGAPIIGPDGMVESGNARSLAIRRAYRDNPEGAQAYRRFLEEQGFNVAGMSEPVLVRRRTSDLSPEDRVAFATEANERSTLSMSATETAGADARALSDGLLENYRGGDLNNTANRPFVRAFIDGAVNPAERGAMMGPDGSLSQDGVRRIQNALFHRAYEAPDLLAKLRETTDTNVKGIGDALMEVAPAWARLRGQVAAGTVAKDMDVTRPLMEAVGIVQHSRAKGRPVADALRQGDLYGSGVSREAAEALRLFYRDAALTKARNSRDVANGLRYYIEQASQRQAGPGLFAGTEANPADVLRLARERLDGGLLSDAAEMRPASRTQDELPDVAAMAPPGSNYTGMVPQKYDPSVIPTGKPIRREDILADFAKGLGSPIYSGRVKSDKTLGFFRKHIQEVRIKRNNDIEVAAHEMAHLLDDRFPEIRAQWLPASNANATIRKELAGVSYDQSKLYEGFAEFVRLWMTQTAEARAKAPAFYGWFEDFVARSPHGPALRKAQRDMGDWFAQAALDRARSKIGETRKAALPDRLARKAGELVGMENMGRGVEYANVPVMSRFRQTIADDLQGIRAMERDLTGTTSPLGAYETARLVRGKTGIIEGALTIGAPKVMPDGSHKFVGKSLRDILQPVDRELDDFLMYAVGRSARELKTQRRERLFSEAEIRAMTALDKPEFRRAFDEYQRWNAAILDFAQAKGLIDPMARAMWRRFDYVPFHRIGTGGNFSPVAGDWRGIKALTGGSENIRDVLGNMIRNASTLIDAALTNEARLKVAQLAKQEGGARFMAQIPKEEIPIKVHYSEIERAILEALGVEKKSQLGPDQRAIVDDIVSGLSPMTELLMRGQTPLGPNVVAVLKQGKPEYYEVADPILYRSLTSLNRAPAHWIVRALAVPKRISQATITMAPDFLAANFARDTIMAGVMSRHGFKPFLDSVRGMGSRIKSDENYRDFLANGGGLSSYLLDEGSYRTHLEQFYTRKGIDYRTVLDAPAKLLLGLEKITDAIEMSARLGEFRKAKAAGEHPRSAAYRGREVSTDFAMRGDSSVLGFMYDTIIFLKAGVNSVDRLYRGVIQDPNRLNIAAKTGTIGLLSLGLYALNRGNPLYEQIEDWDRDTHWHFFVPTKSLHDFRAEHGRDPRTAAEAEGKYVHFRYPKIWEVGAVGSIAERSAQGFLDNAPAETVKHTGKILRDLFNWEYIPQAFAPVVESAMNKNRFTDRPIESRALGDLQPWARASTGTSATLRKMGESTRDLPRWAQLSPAKVEHLLRGYFNTLASYGLSLSDGLFFDEAPAMRADQYPVARRFYRQEPARSTKAVDELFEVIHEATELRRTMRSMDRQYRPDIAGELESRHENEMYRQLTRAERQMATYRRDMEAVVRAPDLAEVQGIARRLAEEYKNPALVQNARMNGEWLDSPTLRRRLLDEVTRRRNQFADEVMGDVREQKRARSLPAPSLPPSPPPTPISGFPAGGAPGSFARGGPVTPARLTGPNPPGPDDGYAPLDAGEFVVRAGQAAKFRGLLDAINNGDLDGVNLPNLLGYRDRSGYMTLTPQQASKSAGAVFR